MSYIYKPRDLDASGLSTARRRDFLFGGIGGAISLLYGSSKASRLTAAEAAASHCALNSEQEIGPYYLDYEMMRKDITEGKPGLPLKLRVVVMDVTRCEPIENAALDIWHCDAAGVYSGYTKNSPDGFGGPGGGPGGRRPGGRGPGGMPPPDGMGPGDGQGPPRDMPPPDFAGDGPGRGGPDFTPHPTDKTKFCRGVQLADSRGLVEFDTIYPGWYVGRDIHIHVRIHIGGKVTGDKYQGGHVSHTGQLFFPDDLTDKIAKLEPYAGHHADRTRQTEDQVFLSDHDTGAIMTMTPLQDGSAQSGYVATAILGVDPAATPKGAQRSPGGGRPPSFRRL